MMNVKRIFLLMIVLCSLVVIIGNALSSNIMTVSGTSMEPTLKDGDRIFVIERTDLRKSDIVVITVGDERFVKRIVAIPGDTIHIRDGCVYVNGKKADELYTEFAGIAFEPLTLGDDEYFVLGDNRAQSKDSRYKDIGVICKTQIVYKVLLY